MKLNYKALAGAFFGTLAVAAIAWAISVNEIWQSVYDASNTALRISIVTGS